LISDQLKEDLDDAFLYIYYCVRYKDDQIFKIILTKTDRFKNCANLDMVRLLTQDRAYARLTEYTGPKDSTNVNQLLKGGDIARMNQIAFEIALSKNYEQIASHFIKNDLILLTWKMVETMLMNSQERLFKLCIRY
jgi:hypothetical protein